MTAEPGSTLLASPPEEGSRRLALRWIDEATASADRILAGGDDEGLHDLRVALRKLRTVLRTFRKPLRGAIPKKRQARLKELVAATGVARDSEVMLEWLDAALPELDEDARAGASALRARIADRKDAAYVRLRSATVPALAQLLPKLHRDLSVYELEHHVAKTRERARFGDLAAELVTEQAEELAAALERVRSIEDEELAHEARIHGKRLRYLLEPLRELAPAARDAVKTLKGIQDLLGELNDVAVRVRALKDELERAALERARALTSAGALPTVDEQPALVALVRHSQRRREELFARLLAEWIADPTAIARLLGDVRALAEALRAAPAEEAPAPEPALPREIERKYLLRALPAKAREVEPIEIDQGYLPGEQLHERLRRMRASGSERWYRCVKLGKGISRIEIEEETSREVYAKLWPLTKGRRVRKRRYEVPEGDHVFQIDEFVDRELYLCEVELASETEAVALPEWLAPLIERDVTGEPAYVNLNLAR